MAFSDKLLDDLINHNIDLLRFDAGSRRRIRAQLVQMQERITAVLSNVDFSNVRRQARLQGLLIQVEKIIQSSYRGAKNVLLKDLTELAAMEQGFVVEGMNGLFKVDIMSASLTPEKLRALVKTVNVMGAPAAEWWKRQAAKTRNAFVDQMRQGFLLGESTQDLVRRVRGVSTGKRQLIELPNGNTKSVHVFAGGILETSTREAEALVRTSVQSIANEVRLKTYQSNSDVIKSIQAQVTLDSRTSDICMAHGAIPDEWDIKTFEPLHGSGPWLGPPPWHFNCRSSLVPVTKSWEELQKQAGAGTRKQRRIARKLDNNSPKSTRASMNGQVPKGISFSKWLSRQPKSVQLDLLGPTKRKLWLEDKLSLTQLIDQSGRPLTIPQIKKKIGVK